MLRQFAELINELASWQTLVVVLFVAEPLVAFAHELGHGLVAAARLPGEVVVQVGGAKPLFRWRLGRLDVRVHPLVIPGRFGGECRFDGAHCTRSDAVWIALAGPAGALAFGAGIWALGGRLAPAGPLHTFATMTLLVAVVSSLLCLVPLNLTDSTGVTRRTDGARALAAAAGR
jgi:hypothetical protein